MAATVLILALVAFVGVCTGAPNRIVGGEMTSIERYPSIVQVEYMFISWSHYCGGSLLNEGYILSAAHCFGGWGYDREYRRIRLGTSFRNRGGTIVNIDREYNHPTYNEASINNFDGDITVVRLAQLVQYSTVIQPVTIAAPGFQLSNNSPVVHAGWGTMSSGGSKPNLLRHVTIYTIDRQLCTERYLNNSAWYNVTENMICAGILDVGGKDACQGDSGGPMYYGDILVGVVSWSIGCGDPHFPGVSTAVSSYTDWIVATAV